MVWEFSNLQELEAWDVQRDEVWDEYGLSINPRKTEVLTRQKFNHVLVIEAKAVAQLPEKHKPKEVLLRQGVTLAVFDSDEKARYARKLLLR
jgi:hypothetical protein